MIFCEADLYKRRGRSSSSESARVATRGMRRAGDGRGLRSHVHCGAARGERGAPGRQHSQLSPPHASHATAAFRSSFPRLKAPSRRASASADTSSRGPLRSVAGRTAEFFTHGSGARRADRGRPLALFKSTSLIFRHGSPRTVTASARRRGRASSAARGAASGEERSLRTARGTSASGECAGEAAADAAAEGAGRSEWERARGVCARLAGVTSLSERRWMRRRTPAGESASVTLMLMLCDAALGLSSSRWTSFLATLLSFSLKLWEPTEPSAFVEFLLGPALLGPAPAS